MATEDLTLPMKVAIPCYLVGTVVFLICFSVDYWLQASHLFTETFKNGADFHAGLWNICFSSGNTKHCFPWTDDVAKDLRRDWFHKTQALECLALIMLIVLMGALVVFCLTKMKLATVTSVVACFLSAVFIISASSIFAQDLQHDDALDAVADITWAFGFNIVAGIFLVVAGGAIVAHIVVGRSTSNPPVQ